MQESKVASYLGLARRAGKLTLGVQAAETLRGGVYLLVADPCVAPNNRKKIEKLQAKLGCPLVFFGELEGCTGKPFCKLAAVRDENLARAIISQI